MRNAYWFAGVLTILVVALAAVAWANPIAGPPASSNETKVVLKTVDVTVDIRKAPAPKLAKPATSATATEPTPPDGKAPAIADWIEADVTCSYDLLCTQSVKSPVTLATGFPVSFMEDPNVKVTSLARTKSFTVEADGKIPDSLTRKTWILVGTDGKTRHYSGYGWNATLQRDVKQTVKIRYSLLLPVRDGASAFTYILRSGSTWPAPIEHETVRVKAAAGLALKPAESADFAPAVQPDGSLVWELKNAIPKEDVHVVIQPDAEPPAKN
jgi:hypothetical protein